jgi:hypothetical protein
VSERIERVCVFDYDPEGFYVSKIQKQKSINKELQSEATASSLPKARDRGGH